MDTIYISILGTQDKIPFTLTYGIQKELQDYLFKDDRLVHMLMDPEVSDTVLKICLSERNDKGQIIREVDTNAFANVDEVEALLSYIFEYFSEFFLKNQLKIQKLMQKVSQISAQSEAS